VNFDLRRKEMKYLMVVILLNFNCAIAVAQSTNPQDQHHTLPPRQGSGARLQLTTTIIRQYSCSFNTHGMKLRLTFRNNGNKAVILDKRSFHVASFLSTSLKAAAAKKYVGVIRGDMWGLVPLRPDDLSDFVILQPGEVYEAEKGSTASFMVTNEPANPHHLLSPGSYFLQIKVATWSYLEDGRAFQKAWSDKGYLWFQGLISEPMPFIVKRDRQIEKCL
jgi:hypothetical protein